MRRFERPEQLPPALRDTRYYLFEGGCVTYEFSVDGPDSGPMFDAEGALAFQARAPLVDAVHRRSGLTLCGAGAPPCTGGS
jgi:hypothetical protein